MTDFHQLIGVDPSDAFRPKRPRNSFGANKLFIEALSLYLNSYARNNVLTPEVRQALLIAIHGLTKLDNYPLARALIRLSFSDLTADETLSLIELSHNAQHQLDCTINF